MKFPHLSLGLLSYTSLILAASLVALGHSALFSSFFGRISWIEDYEMRVLDGWFNLRGPLAPPDNVVIVTMDEDSYRTIGVPLNQPLPRWVHAKLIKTLSSYKAKRVAFDVLFVGESTDPVSDQELADAISTMPTVLGAETRIQKDFLVSRGFMIEPHKPFALRAERLGLVGFSEDNGYVRRFFRAIPDFAGGYVPLSEAAVGRSNLLDNGPGVRDLINFYGPPETITKIPLYQVIDQDIPQITIDALSNLFKDKIVFVGLSLNTGLSAEQKDSYLTPYSSSDRTFGVEIHATCAANIIDENWIRRASLATETFYLAIVSFLLTLALVGLRPLFGGLVLVSGLVIWAFLSYYQFLNLKFIPGAFLFTIILPIIFLVSSIVYYVITRRSQMRLKRAFDLYISPEMSNRLSRDPASVRLGGEKVVATALFTDIVGFTQISEKLSAEEVAQMLNKYFTEVMDVIFSNQGTLIKFIGDAVFCIWGSPIKVEDHQVKACQTALAIQMEVDKFNASGRFPPLHTRIGISTGPMVIGNLGSKKRFDYTAVGDTVNLASRVESLNRVLGTKILVTESVVEALADRFNYLFLGKINVVGKKQSVGVYTLLHEAINESEKILWQSAISLFTERKWNEAREQFRKIINSSKILNVAAEFYIKQINNLELDPPSSVWQGELVVVSK